MSAAAVAPRPGVSLRVGRAVLTGIAAVLYAVGWAAGAVWLAVSWPALAVFVGWRDATTRRGGSRA